jgi:two-component system, NtrC family, nitrogen regulation response regulator NtrX
MPYVLIVEDNDSASGALRVLFEATGHRVAVARTVAEATATIESSHPDLVLLDLTLPDGDGFGVLRRLGEHPGKKPVVVALTGHDDPDIAQRCASLGCADVLVKPVSPRKLLADTSKWLGDLH